MVLSNPETNKVTFKLDLPRHCHIAPLLHLSCLKPIIPGPLATDMPQDTHPAPLDINGQLAYLVKMMLRYSGREEQCWIPAQVILDPNLCQEFHVNLGGGPERVVLLE